MSKDTKKPNLLTLPDREISELEEAANGLHDMFEANIKAGFAREEALYLVAAVLGRFHPPSTK